MALLQLPEKLLYPLGPRGGKVWLKPGAGLEYYRFAYQAIMEPGFWHRHFPILDETTQEFHCTEPTDAQLECDQVLITERQAIAWKYRQAYFTTEGCNRMVVEHQYLEGIQGIIVSATDKLAKEAMRRINEGYEAFSAMHPELAVPLKTGRDAGSQNEIVWCHGGKIMVLSAEGRVPGISFSPSRIMISEMGEMADQTAKDLFRLIGPSISKKGKDALVFIESTPGFKGGYYYNRCMNALMGKSSFFPIFVPWWHDKNAREENEELIRAFEPDEREAALLESIPDLTPASLLYLRRVVADWFDDDFKLAENAYPWSPMSGWKTGESTSLPAELFDPLLMRTKTDSAARCGLLGIPGYCEA